MVRPATPLQGKLGLKPPLKLLVLGAPREYRSWLGRLPPGVVLTSSPASDIQAAHLFVSTRASLEDLLSGLRRRLRADGFVWVSWPKKTSKVPTDITEDGIRQVALPLGLVDVKVCAVSDVWSGLKLVIRRTERIERRREHPTITVSARRRGRLLGRRAGKQGDG